MLLVFRKPPKAVTVSKQRSQAAGDTSQCSTAKTVHTLEAGQRHSCTLCSLMPSCPCPESWRAGHKTTTHVHCTLVNDTDGFHLMYLVQKCMNHSIKRVCWQLWIGLERRIDLVRMLCERKCLWSVESFGPVFFLPFFFWGGGELGCFAQMSVKFVSFHLDSCTV